jgi:WD40 repeat protein
MTQHGLILGTPSYMPPEQVAGKGRTLSRAVDVYSLGAILYELLTGRPPFLAGSIESTLAMVASEDPIPPRRLQPEVPRDLETICLKCLEKEPARRYGTAAEFADDLARFLAGESVQARAPSTLDRWVKLTRRHRIAVVGAAGVLVTLVLGSAATSVMALRESRARRLADRNAHQATQLAREAKGARTAARREAYQARLAAAMGAIGNHDIYEATRQLESAPNELRGWEWRHLQGRLDQSLAVVAGLPGTGNIAFCPPGERIAVADGRGYRVLDAVTGKCLARRTTDRTCHNVYAFMTRWGPRFLFDTSDESLCFCLADEDGVPLGRLTLPTPYQPGRNPNPFVIALSPDGTRVALQSQSYSTSPLIEVFDVCSGQRTASCGKPRSRLLGVAFSPDGTRIAPAPESSKMFLFDAATGQSVATLAGSFGAVRAVAYSPDGRRVATCGDDQRVHVWDALTGEWLNTLHGDVGRVSCMAFSPDGRWLVSGGSDSTVRLWRSDGGEEVLILQGHTAKVNSVAFSTDGRMIASAAADGTARLWDATMRDDPRVLRGHQWHVYPVAYSPDGRWIASGSWDKTVRLCDAASGRPVHVLRSHIKPIGALAFTPDGTRLATWAEDLTIRIWETATGREIEPALKHKSMTYRDSVYSLVVSPDGKRLGAVMAGGVRFWDLATRAELETLRLPIRGVRVVAFSPDGTRIAAGGDDAKVVIVDATSGSLIAEFTGFKGRIQSLAFSPDGRQVLTAGKEPTLRLWDAATGRLVRTFGGHSLEVLSAIFHPDGTRIASGGHDRSILIWDAATGDELVRLPGHTSYAFSLAFSPDGETLVSGSGDATVRLWDTFPVARRHQARRAAESPIPRSNQLAREEPPRRR